MDNFFKNNTLFKYKYLKYISKLKQIGGNKFNKLILNEDELGFLGFNMEGYKVTINSNSKLFVLDCEMVITNLGQEVAWLTLVDQNRNPIIDKKVKPNGTITDYVTHITGYTEETFRDITTTIDDIIVELKSFVSEHDILAGHNIFVDIKSLGGNFNHFNIIDTKILFPHPDGPPSFHSLKYLAERYTTLSIQKDIHNSVEDCYATYDLIQYFLKQGYIKPTYKKPTLEFTDNTPPQIEHIVEAIEISEKNILALFLKGSRAIGTQGIRGSGKISDWDYIAVIDDQIQVVSDTIIKYGNIDIALYNYSYFKNMLYDHVIWVLEAVYVNDPNPIILNKVNFPKMMEEFYLKVPEVLWTPYLGASVGEWNAKKIGNSKRFLSYNIYKSKKQIFFAHRFTNYGIDILKYKKIRDLRAWNDIWKVLKNDTEFTVDKYLKQLDTEYKEFRSLLPYISRHGGLQQDLVRNFYTYNKELTEEGNIPFNHTQNTILHNNDLSNYMRSLNKTPNDIVKYLYHKFGITGRRHPEYPNLIQFTYSVWSPINDMTTKFNRVIFDSITWNIVGILFDRIFDIKSKNTHRLNLESITIQKQYDGTLIIMYYYDQNWHISTKNYPSGNEFNKKNKIKINNLFWEIWKEKNYDINNLNTQLTYAFEIVSPQFTLNIPYTSNDLILVCAKNNETLEEINLNLIQKFKTSIKTPLSTSISELVQQIKNKRFATGIILTDSNSNKVKISTTEYIKIAYIGIICTGTAIYHDSKKVLKIVQLGDKEKFLIYFPSFVVDFEKVESKYNEMIDIINRHYEQYKIIETPKEFYTQVNKIDDRLIKNTLINMKKYNVTVNECFATFETDNLHNLLFGKKEYKK